MVETNQPYYDVTFYDNWLEVEDFKSIPADSEEDARAAFWDEVGGDEERYDIESTEYAFTLPELNL